MRFGFLTISAVILASPLFAQADRPVYKVDFLIRDGGEPAKPAARYSVLTEGDTRTFFRGNTRAPYTVPPAASSGKPPQVNFTDIGFTLDCEVRETAGKVTLTLKADFTLADMSRANQPPLVTHVTLNVRPSLTLGKPGVIASLDDPVAARKLDFEALVTKLN
ncbi:MAG: hypothetical protein K2X35_11490 [Bryobacteraceae bacterium]|nr:hypothetical protein [Bryobacteraceae bacterium]